MPEVKDFADQVIDNVEKVIVGKREAIELLIVTLLVEGHALLEDIPGVGKTMLARSIAISLGGKFNRLQCTPDLLPNDITGVSVFNQKTNAFEFRPGPIFVNILLADEINRATPRTQSALLEAMQEQQVTIDGITRLLPRPFLVMATQNPIEYEGTFPLPEAQLDRFLIKLSLGYPAPKDEKEILQRLRRTHPIHQLTQAVEDGLFLGLQEKIWDVYVDDSLESYIIDLVSATRNHPDLVLGVSPRGSLALYKAAQAFAAVRGRDHVIPDDIKYLIPYTMPHRVIIRPEAELRGKSVETVLKEISQETSIPDLEDF